MARPEEYEGRCAQIDAIHPQLGRRSIQAPQCGKRKTRSKQDFNGQSRLTVDTAAHDSRSMKLAECELALRQKCNLIFRLTYAAVLRFFGFALAFVFICSFAASSSATAFWSFSASTR